MQVGLGGLGPRSNNAPGFCGTPSVLSGPGGLQVVAFGGAGGTGTEFRSTAEQCTGDEGGGGGTGPSNPHNSHPAYDWTRSFDSSGTNRVNVTQYSNNGRPFYDASAIRVGEGYGGGGGGAGGPARDVDSVHGTASRGCGGFGLQTNFDGQSRFYAAGGAGASYALSPGSCRSASGIGGEGGWHNCDSQRCSSVGGRAEPTPGTAHTGSGGGGATDRCSGVPPNWARCGEGFETANGGHGIVIVRFRA